MKRKLIGTVEAVTPVLSGDLSPTRTLNGTIRAFGSLSGEIVNPSAIYVYDYERLTNKPKINGVEVVSEKSIEDYGMEEMTNFEIEDMMED